MPHSSAAAASAPACDSARSCTKVLEEPHPRSVCSAPVMNAVTRCRCTLYTGSPVHAHTQKCLDSPSMQEAGEKHCHPYHFLFIPRRSECGNEVMPAMRAPAVVAWHAGSVTEQAGARQLLPLPYGRQASEYATALSTINTDSSAVPLFCSFCRPHDHIFWIKSISGLPLYIACVFANCTHIA